MFFQVSDIIWTKRANAMVSDLPSSMIIEMPDDFMTLDEPEIVDYAICEYIINTNIPLEDGTEYQEGEFVESMEWIMSPVTDPAKWMELSTRMMDDGAVVTTEEIVSITEFEFVTPPEPNDEEASA